MALRIKAKQLDEKRRLELYAVIYFIAAYRRLFPGWPTLIEMPAPPEPDFIVRLGAGQVGVEVAHLFGSERDARLRLGRAQADESTREAQLQHSLVPLNVRVPIELNRILWQKAAKAYPRPTWLVIRNAYPLWERCDFEMYPAALVVPTTHAFEQIWLLCDRNGASGMIRLFPSVPGAAHGAAGPC